MKEIVLHQPVLQKEVITHLVVNPTGAYLEGTFGRGGHASAILNSLSATGRLLAMDKDVDAVLFAKKLFSTDKRFVIEHDSFAHLDTFVKSHTLFGKLNGILLDLGVSSPQLDEGARGFSFLREGPLDMRMDQTQSLDASAWLAKVKEQELITVLKTYGEEKYAKRIARAIIEERKKSPIDTTQRLADIVAAAHPAWEIGKHPATKTFLALRLVVNQELEELKQGLSQCLEALAIGGRLLVISFHSLEDRIVKQFIQHHEKGDDFPSRLPIKRTQLKIRLKRLGKTIYPTPIEIKANPRARSAKLRIAEKIV